MFRCVDVDITEVRSHFGNPKTFQLKGPLIHKEYKPGNIKEYHTFSLNKDDKCSDQKKDGTVKS